MNAQVGTITEHGQTRPLYSTEAFIVQVSARQECATQEVAEELRAKVEHLLRRHLSDELKVEVSPVSTDEPEAEAA